VRLIMNRESTPISEPVAQLQRQLEQFRSTQPGRTKLPESLWQAAVELARHTACIPSPIRCGLDYTRLKKRLGESPTFRRKETKPAFVELVAPSHAQLEECVIEFESSGGSKMRIQWKATAPPDWTALLRAWRETEG
jgi:hypothetical protein